MTDNFGRESVDFLGGSAAEEAAGGSSLFESGMRGLSREESIHGVGFLLHSEETEPLIPDRNPKFGELTFERMSIDCLQICKFNTQTQSSS